MNFKKLLVAALPAMLLASCASDEPGVNPGGESTKGGFYATIKLDASSTRSNTTETPNEGINSSSGYEIDQPYESNIQNVTIVLATKADENAPYLAQTFGTYTSSDVAAGPDASPTNNVFTIQFEDTQIVNLHDQKVYVFAFCNTDLNENNFTAGTKLEDLQTRLESEAIGQGIWEPKKFMMVNAPNRPITTKDMPGENALRNNFNTPEKALNLGSVDVARTAARFDYKQVNENKYPIVDPNNENQVIANIEMVSMAPFNIAKDFYTLPRVSADGQKTGWEICGNEVYNTVSGIGNYVVSPYAEAIKNASSVANLSGNYFQALATANSYNETYFTDEEDFVNIAAWYKGAEDDSDENWNTGDHDGYKIWRYVSENTIPLVDNQKKGISTGVVFKAKLTDATGLMQQAMDVKKPIYFYNGTCYGDIANLRRVVANLDESATMRQKFEQVFAGKEYLVFEKAADGTRNYKVADDKLVDATSAENNSTFKIIRPDESGTYYLYYVYYNRHNDNGNNSVMAPMEFATVRNNVYKLSVTKVTDFGHTNDPKDDPDPEDPDNPDESPKTYFQVSCRVLPWIVRINNIPF